MRMRVLYCSNYCYDIISRAVLPTNAAPEKSNARNNVEYRHSTEVERKCVSRRDFFFFQIMQLAIALYNNNVDDEEELEFRKGDLLTVLIENPHGLDGWWLCQHRGKCGLCPGNRLKLLPASNATARDSADFVRFPSHLSTASVSSHSKREKHRP